MSKQNSNKVVLYQPPKQKQVKQPQSRLKQQPKQNLRKVGSLNPSKKSEGGVGNVAFFKALTDPFAPSSMGCQVPDPFPFPTNTFHVHQTTVLGSSAGFSSGGTMFCPNPLLSMVDLTFVNSLVQTKKSVQNTPMTPVSVTTTIPGNGIYQATSQSSLNAVYSTYRVVSWGIKISNLQPELTATGRLMLAYFPAGDTVPTLGDIQGALLSGVVSPIVGINSLSLESSVILNAPTAVELTVGDLLHGDMQLSGLISNMSFFQFKSTLLAGQSVTGNSMGDDISITAAGAVTSTQYKDATRMPGGACIVLFWEGLPPGTTNAFQVETIYHLEGTPNFASTTNNAIMPSTGAKPHVGPTNAVEASISAAGLTKNLFTYIRNGFEFLNENKEAVMTVASMIP